MLQYLVILLDDTSIAFCHASNPLTSKHLIDKDVLKKAAADENSERQKRGFKPKKRFQLVLDSSSGLMEHDIPVSFSAEKRLFAGRMVQIKDFEYVSEQNHT